MSLASYWNGSQIDLLDLLEIDSSTLREINKRYISLQESAKIKHSDFYEVQPERFLGISTGYVSFNTTVWKVLLE